MHPGNGKRGSRIRESAPIRPAEPTLASATALPYEDQSVDAIVTDPPYYDNIMYAELSDYFYVWLKRSLKPYWPELCQQPLSDKDNEAVSNSSPFRRHGYALWSRQEATRCTVTAQELAEGPLPVHDCSRLLRGLQGVAR